MSTLALRSLLLAIPLCLAARADVTLPAIFSDHMVFQRNDDARLWGKADADESIEIRASWRDDPVAIRADATGHWNATIPTSAAAGPQTITLRGKNTITLRDVLLGEVWLCSGQSNMEWSVGPAVGPGVMNFKDELTRADHPEIRLFQVQHARADKPMDDCTGRWAPCSAETVTAFSAAGYFFGRRLHQELKTPIGLIQSTWGGTPIEYWMSEPTLRAIPDFAAALDKQPEAKVAYAKALAAWEEECKAADAGDGKWHAADFDDAAWRRADALSFEKLDLANFDGVVWFRATIEVASGAAGREATLDLGAIDDEDVTWLNGRRLGATNVHTTPRAYPVPAGALRAGENTLAVRVRDTGGFGGFAASPREIALRIDGGRLIPSNWRYAVGVDAKSLKPRPAQTWNDASILYNAMIAPLVPFTLRGVIWYQGESNVNRAFQYRTAFPAMIEGWRRDFRRPEMPFYYVQIAPFEYVRFQRNPPEPWTHPSAELREAQLRTLKTPHTGMVVVSDITDNVADIHPANKQDVGDRLARWALAGPYGRTDVVVSGPLYRSMTVEGGAIRLTFDHVGGGLVARGGDLTDFTIAGEDRKFVAATATIDGDTIVVRAASVPKPVAVRFGWTDTARPNLFNRAGLPASPFRTDDWPGATDAATW